MHDETESFRRAMIADGIPKQDLVNTEGPVWSTTEMRRDFDVVGFMAPFVVVRRKPDGKRGTLEFTDQPRLYFDWQEDWS